MVIYIAYYLGVVFRMSGAEIIQLKDTYITEFARKIASNSGALIMQLFIIISVLGTSNGLLLATIRVPYQFSNLEKSKKFLNLSNVDEKTKMPVNSAVFGTLLITFYLLIYYFTNTHPFFTEKNFDLSAIPILFIYLVNVALFIGLFQLFRKKTFSKNSFFRKMMTIIAVFGNILVIFGTVTSPNGLTYFVITIFFLLGGFLLMRRI